MVFLIIVKIHIFLLLQLVFPVPVNSYLPSVSYIPCLLSIQKTHDQIEKACDDLIVFDNLVVLAERVTNLVTIVEKYESIG